MKEFKNWNFWQQIITYLALIIPSVICGYFVNSKNDSNYQKYMNEKDLQIKQAQEIIKQKDDEILTAQRLAAKYCLEKEIAMTEAGKLARNQKQTKAYYDKIINDIDNWSINALDSFFAVDGRQKN